jgi:hypothetical protein
MAVNAQVRRFASFLTSISINDDLNELRLDTHLKQRSKEFRTSRRGTSEFFLKYLSGCDGQLQPGVDGLAADARSESKPQGRVRGVCAREGARPLHECCQLLAVPISTQRGGDPKTLGCWKREPTS